MFKQIGFAYITLLPVNTSGGYVKIKVNDKSLFMLK
jgi:hypothetical protein